MKILILSNNPLSHTSNNGKTIASIVSVLRENEFAQIHFSRESVEADFSLIECGISDEKVLRLFADKLFPTRCFSKEQSLGSPTSNTVRGLFSKASRFSKEFYRLMREILWFLPLGHKNELIDFAVKFKPDILFFVAGDFIFSNRLAIELQEKTGCRMVTYFTDDYIFIKHGWNIFGHLRSLLVFRVFRQIVALSSSYLTISHAMKDRYDSVFNKASSLAYNVVEHIVDDEDKSLDPSRNEIVTIVYAGGLHLDRLSSIEILAKYVENLSSNVRIKVFSGDSADSKVRKRMSCYKRVELMDPVTSDALRGILRNADILLHVESFDAYYASRTRYSLSTKIPEYLSFGKPILAIGPEFVASMRHLQECSICITQPEVEITKVKRLLQSKDFRTAMGKLSIQKFKKDHNKKSLEKNIRRAFSNGIN